MRGRLGRESETSAGTYCLRTTAQWHWLSLNHRKKARMASGDVNPLVTARNRATSTAAGEFLKVPCTFVRIPSVFTADDD
jgi:hypothetical protein